MPVTFSQNQFAAETGPGSERLTLASSGTAARIAITITWILWLALWLYLLRFAPAISSQSGVFFTYLIIGIVLTIPLTITMIETHRFALWLQGTDLTVRHWRGTRMWDLSSSTVMAHKSWGKIKLTIRDDVSGRRHQLKLRTRDLRHVGALATAITTGRPGDPVAHRAAEVLVRAVN